MSFNANRAGSVHFFRRTSDIEPSSSKPHIWQHVSSVSHLWRRVQQVKGIRLTIHSASMLFQIIDSEAPLPSPPPPPCQSPLSLPSQIFLVWYLEKTTRVSLMTPFATISCNFRHQQSIFPLTHRRALQEKTVLSGSRSIVQ